MATGRQTNNPEIKSGQYWAVKVRGTGGDLVLGRVQSYRSGGFVVSENLLTSKISTKGEKIFRQRNKQISKRHADRLLKMFREGATKAEVREAAVNTPAFGEKARQPKKQLELPQASVYPIGIYISREECQKLIPTLERLLEIAKCGSK